MKVGVVTKFEGEYRFLSNFFEAEFVWRNIKFPTGEHAFQSAKHLAMTECTVKDMQNYVDRVLAQPTPHKAKYEGRSVRIDSKHWDDIKVGIMREIVHSRFANNLSDFDMVGSLINTGAMMLVEGNDWDDRFWGRCNGKGFNTLGALLMQERGYWLSHELVCPNCKHVYK